MAPSMRQKTSPTADSAELQKPSPTSQDWAGLPAELRGLILQNLTVPDHSRFRLKQHYIWTGTSSRWSPCMENCSWHAWCQVMTRGEQQRLEPIRFDLERREFACEEDLEDNVFFLWYQLLDCGLRRRISRAEREELRVFHRQSLPQ